MSNAIPANWLLKVWTGYAAYQPPDIWGSNVVHTYSRAFGPP
jgi:hypothetical protein